ncbi:hypothetical protein [Butyrivibrio sp.]|uniref:hypothetical protein n=1 Tax=Butyrivibrio sp. TaxID=28121 RepID=UPI0025C71EDC|nr:hypothetical protein [Butyrivibrio sp.]MBQ7431333.1 hypothetical protein [Butyrivibrio sp.]MBQ9302727.1 hypothetical protein [Butyrivibrio sp.]
MKHTITIGEKQKDGSIPIIVDGTQYWSMTAMIKAFHTNQTAIYNLEKQGYPREEAISIAIERTEQRMIEKAEKEKVCEKLKAEKIAKIKDKKHKEWERENNRRNAIKEIGTRWLDGTANINKPPEISDEDIWQKKIDGKCITLGNTPRKPVFHKREEEKNKKYAVSVPFCPMCDHPLFKYDRIIGDYVWGYGAERYIYDECPGCGQKIMWDVKKQ